MSKHYSWQLGHYDGCLTTPDTDMGVFQISKHDYSYSMGVDNAWSVDRNSGFGWFGGLPYNYGLEADCFTPAKPHYPVPATIQDSITDLGERWSNWID